MHESIVAKQLLGVVLEKARDEGVTRILSVQGRVAETERLSADALRFHFEAHARGTAAEGAGLELRISLVEARCVECRATYEPDHHVTLCPRCGCSRAELLGPVGVGIDSIEVE